MDSLPLVPTNRGQTQVATRQHKENSVRDFFEGFVDLAKNTALSRPKMDIPENKVVSTAPQMTVPSSEPVSQNQIAMAQSLMPNFTQENQVASNVQAASHVQAASNVQTPNVPVASTGNQVASYVPNQVASNVQTPSEVASHVQSRKQVASNVQPKEVASHVQRKLVASNVPEYKKPSAVQDPSQLPKGTSLYVNGRTNRRPKRKYNFASHALNIRLEEIEMERKSWEPKPYNAIAVRLCQQWNSYPQLRKVIPEEVEMQSHGRMDCKDINHAAHKHKSGNVRITGRVLPHHQEFLDKLQDGFDGPIDYLKNRDLGEFLVQDPRNTIAAATKREKEMFYWARGLCGINTPEHSILRREGCGAMHQWKTNVHKSHRGCTCMEMYKYRNHCDTCYQEWSLSVTNIIGQWHFYPMMLKTDKTRFNTMLRLDPGAQQLRWTQNEEISELLSGTNIGEDQIDALRRQAGFAGHFGSWAHMKSHMFATVKSALFGADPLGGMDLRHIKDDDLNGKSTMLEKLRSLVKRTWESITSFLGNIVSSVYSYIENMMYGIATRLLNLMPELETLQRWLEPIKRMIYVILMMVIAAFGVVSISVVLRLCGITMLDNAMASHSTSVGVILASLIAVIVGYKVGASSAVSCFFRDITTVIAGMTACFGLCTSIGALLPLGVRRWMVEKFGTHEQVADIKYQDWRVRALALIATSQVSKIVVSKEYSENLKRTLAEGSYFVKSLSGKTRAEFLQNFFRLVAVSKTIIQRESQSDVRPIPFTIHLWGQPGVGKTTVYPDILTALGVDPINTYHRNSSEEYWSGFISSEAVVYDEFLIDSERAPIIASEYLSLVSSSKFLPAMPSVDNIATGIKGTCAEPKIVVTINNAGWKCTPNVPASAFYRRRNAVVRVSHNLEYFHNHPELKDKDGSIPPNIDLTHVPMADIMDLEWLNFDFCDPLKPEHYISPEPMSFAQLVFALKQQYKHHEEINELLGNNTKATDTVHETLQEAIAYFHGFPTQTMRFSDLLTKAGMEMSSHGKNRSRTTTKSSVMSTEIKQLEFDVESDRPIIEPNLYVTIPVNPRDQFGRLGGMDIQHDKEIDCWALFQSTVRRRYPRTTIVWDKENMSAEIQQDEGKMNVLALAQVSENYYKQAFESYKKGLDWSSYLSIAASQFCKDPDNHEMWVTAGIVGWVFGMVAICYIITWMFMDKQDQPTHIFFTSESHSARSARESRGKRTSKPVRGVVGVEDHYSHARDQRILIRWNNSTRDMLYVDLGNRYIMVPHHLFSGAAKDNVKTVTLQHSGGSYDLDVEDVISYPEHDIAIFKCPMPTFPCSKSKVEKFITEDEFSQFNKINLLVKSPDPHIVNGAAVSDHKISNVDRSFFLERGFFFTNPKLWEGDCGTLLASADTSVPGKFIGVYVAGGDQSGLRSGLCNVVSREMLEQAIELLEPPQPDPSEMQSHGNLRSLEPVKREEMVYLPTNTQIRRTPLFGKMNVDVLKQPAILSEDDPRTEASLETSIIQRFDSENKARINQQVLYAVRDQMTNFYKANHDDRFKPRLLTIEQAIGGIPGYLASLKVKTSMGWPLVKAVGGKGKTEAFHYYNGQLVISTWFREAVELRLEDMAQNVIPDNRFLAYLKDELVSEEKIQNARTRLIYANDVISVVAFRVVFGYTIAALNNSWRKTPLAIGMNQYSYDMDEIARYLAVNGANLIAGDFKNFDTSYHPEFQRAAYEIFFELSPQATEQQCEYMWQHETVRPRVQLGEMIYNMETLHCSGLVLTTIINCFVNELYLRYSFALLNPGKRFEKYLRAKILGDDHIISIQKTCRFDPILYKEQLALIGQTYTSDDKTKELTAELRPFSNVTFLGAHPVKLNGKWCGAPKIQQLYQTCQFTNKRSLQNGEWITAVITCIEYATLWGEEFFQVFLKEVTRNDEVKYEWKKYQCANGTYTCQSIADVVASRVAGTAGDWGFVSHGGPTKGITTIRDEQFEYGLDYLPDRPVAMEHGMNEPPATIEYGPESLIYRTEVEWTTDNHKDDIVLQVKFPNDLINLGNTNNVQNMMFERFIYTKTDIEFVLQIAGTAFQQGLLVATIYPLGYINTNDYPSGCDTFFAHRLIAPNTNTSVVIPYNFNFYRNFLNTFEMQTGKTEVLGTLVVRVLSPLQTIGTDTKVTLTLFSRFVNPQFRLPRPPGKPAVSYASRFVSHGNAYSNNNNYTIDHVVGNVPVGTTNGGASQDFRPKTDLKATIPMDNPPMLSGAVPMYNAFPSRSKTVGIHTAVGLQHHPEELHRETAMVGRNADTSVAFYCSRPTELARFTWNASDTPNMVKFSCPLNSILQDYTPSAAHVPSCVQPLNMSMFWRADFKFSLVAVTTDYHAGRLRATSCYGTQTYDPADVSIYKNTIMDFCLGSEIGTVTVPYNAPTEYLQRCSVKTNVTSVEMYQSMGTFVISVANRLIAPATVPQSVEVIIFVSLENVRLRESSTIPWTPTVKVSPISPGLKSHSSPDGLITMEPDRVDQLTESESVPLTDGIDKINRTGPCKLDVGRKFEYTWSTFEEITRRFNDGGLLQTNFNETKEGPLYWSTYTFAATFPQVWGGLFWAYAGHVTYRVFFNAQPEFPPSISYFHTPTTEDANSSVAVVPFEGALQDQGVLMKHNNVAFIHPSEDMYPISGAHYIDVSVPFNNVLNYLPFTRDAYNNIDVVHGYISVRYAARATSNQLIKVSVKAGDDFRMFIPLPQCAYQPVDFDPTIKTEVCVADFLINNKR